MFERCEYLLSVNADFLSRARSVLMRVFLTTYISIKLVGSHLYLLDFAFFYRVHVNRIHFLMGLFGMEISIRKFRQRVVSSYPTIFSLGYSQQIRHCNFFTMLQNYSVCTSNWRIHFVVQLLRLAGKTTATHKNQTNKLKPSERNIVQTNIFLPMVSSKVLIYFQIHKMKRYSLQQNKN